MMRYERHLLRHRPASSSPEPRIPDPHPLRLGGFRVDEVRRDARLDGPPGTVLGPVAPLMLLSTSEDGLESAKPDLQSPSKKPGGGPAGSRLWEMLHDG